MDEKYTLFTTGCPKCRILEGKMKNKKMQYDVCDNPKAMQDLGIRSVPVLWCPPGTYSEEKAMLAYHDAVKYVNSLKG